LRIQVIPTKVLPAFWHHLAPLLNKAFNVGDRRVKLQDLYDDALQGTYLVWAIIDEEKKEFVAALTTRAVRYPRGKGLAIEFLGGERMDEWLDELMEELKKHAKHNGCEWLECFGRKGWAKKGWKPAYVAFEMELD
jgi:hypothetical protein